MKKTIVCLTVLASTVLASCENEQEISATKVPQVVMNAFQAKYPNTTPDKWIKETEKGK